MIPRPQCRQCSGDIAPNDRFCANCGAPIDPQRSAIPSTEGTETTPTPSASGDSQPCSLCGESNHPSELNCLGCGAALQSSSHLKPSRTGAAFTEKKGLHFLQSWKFTLGMAIILIGVIAIAKLTREPIVDLAPPPPPHAQEILHEIESLEQAVRQAPANPEPLLRLANLLHDAHFYLRAIGMYEQYLILQPSNADAIVDLGTTYFEMGLSDSMKRGEYFKIASEKILNALTIAPKHQLAFFNLGIIDLHRTEMAKAIEWFKKCIAVDPGTEAAKRAQLILSKHSINNPS